MTISGANPEFSRLYRVAEAFDERAARTRMGRLDAMTLTAFTYYKLIEPFRDEAIQKLRAVRAKYPPPPPRSEIPRVFGFVARPVIEYLSHVKRTEHWPHAWRIDRDGDRLNPDILAFVLNPHSPRYYESNANRVENFLDSTNALCLAQEIRAHDWQPRQLAPAT